MSAQDGRVMELDQLWYGWSHSTMAGRRGYGIVAESEGWDDLLRGGEDVLGPAVAYPTGPSGSDASPSGGFLVLDGVPVVFRRVHAGPDGLNRPDTVAVHLVRGRHEPLDAWDGIWLLDDGTLDDPPPPDGERRLKPLTWLPGTASPRRGGRPDAVALLTAAVLQGQLEGRPVLAQVDSEPDGRALLGAVLERLPGRLRRHLSFSTLETRTSGLPFDVAFRMPDRSGQSTSPGRRTLTVDLTSPGGEADLSAEARRWGRQLATAREVPWSADAEPTDVARLGHLLDVVQASETDAGGLAGADVVTLAGTRAVSAWASRPGSRRSAVRALREVTGPQVGLLVEVCDRDQEVRGVMEDAARECLSGDPEGPATENAEALLRGLGVPQREIDLEQVRRLPPPSGTYGPRDSARILRTLAPSRTDLSPERWAQLARLDWSRDLRQEHPSLWLEAVMRSPGYRGPRLASGEATEMPMKALHAALAGATEGGVTPEDAGRRIMPVLPSGTSDRVEILTRLSHEPGCGLPTVFLGALDSPEATRADRATLLRRRGVHFAREVGLPDYLASAMVPRPARVPLRLSPRGQLVVLAALVAVLVLVVVVVVLL